MHSIDLNFSFRILTYWKMAIETTLFTVFENILKQVRRPSFSKFSPFFRSSKNLRQAKVSTTNDSSKLDEISDDPLFEANVNENLRNYTEKLIELFGTKDCLSSLKEDPENPFYSDDFTDVPILDYVERLIYYANLWAKEQHTGLKSAGFRCARIALQYLERLPPDSRSSIYLLHQYFAVAFLLAIKFTEDLQITNHFWSQVGGFNLSLCNKLELLFCDQMNWQLAYCFE